MTDLKKLTANLEKKGYIVRYFDTPQEAADYLDSRINGKTVAFGGSMTLKAWSYTPSCPLITKLSGTGRGAT